MLDTTASAAQYRGDGGQSVFPVPFPFLEAAHIRAHVRDGDGRTRGLTAGVDYIVNRAGGGNGELVLLAENLPPGHVLTIRRQLPLTQEIFFHNQGPNSPRAMEEAADKLTMIAQQLQADLEQCVRASDPEAAAAMAERFAESASRVAALEGAIAAKAERSHGHAAGDVAGLAAALAAKADAAATEQALAGKAALAQLALKADAASLSAKADRSELARKADAADLAAKADKTALDAKADIALVAAKADAGHAHAAGDIAGLSAALAALEGKLGGKLDADDPRLDNLFPAADLDAIRSSLSALAIADGAIGEALGLKADRSELAERLDALGELALAADAPPDDGRYVRQNRSWVALQTPPPGETGGGGGDGGGGGGGGGIVGDIRLLPFRPDALPAAWYFCNGDFYPVETDQGRALLALPESFRSDWGIRVADGRVCLPRLFDPVSGAGMFLRSVDGAGRLPGSVQGDAIRNITGSYTYTTLAGAILNNTGATTQLTGAFARPAVLTKSAGLTVTNYGSGKTGELLFNASLVVPTAEENRPVNAGMTPAIYLGV